MSSSAASSRGRGVRSLVIFTLVLSIACTRSPEDGSDGPPAGEARADASFTIGVVFPEHGPLGEFGKAGRDAVALALTHINDGGGVLGAPVELVHVDAGVDPDKTVAAIEHLAGTSSLDALIGPLGSAAALAVAQRISGPLRLPTITPTASSPELSSVADGGYLFRSTVSDAAQAPILARLAVDEGFEHVAVLYLDDAYGRGLFDAFSVAYSGRVSARPIESGQATYADELRAVATDGAQALIAMSYEPTASVYLPEAKTLGLFDRFLLVDGTLSQDFVDLVGAELLEGVKGTSSVSDIVPLNAQDGAGSSGFAMLFEEAYGRQPAKGIEANAYDIAICLCLAAEHVGSTDGEAIRRGVYRICSGDGETFGIGPHAVAAALAAVREDRVVDFDGAASALDFDANGDLAYGEIGVWQFQRGTLVEIGRESYSSQAAGSADVLSLVGD